MTKQPKEDFVAIPGNCNRGYERHNYRGDVLCWRCGKAKPVEGALYCHQCGYRRILWESAAEGYSCPNCGSSNSDE